MVVVGDVMIDAKDGFDEAAADFDCGDNSCRYAKDKGGMRTNGGCRCAILFPRKVEFYLRSKINRTEAERDALKAEVERLNKVILRELTEPRDNKK